jgi:hypothetical protein
MVENKIENVKQKLIDFAENKIKWAEKNGRTRFETCNHSGWDKDIWLHKYSIMDYIRSKGYIVTSETNHGVLDVFITKKIDLT